MLRGAAVLEAVPSHVLLGAHVVLYLQASVEDGFLLCRPAKQGKHLVKGELSTTGGWKALYLSVNSPSN